MPGSWRLTTGSNAPYDMRWHPHEPCVWTINNTQAFLNAFSGMTLTFVGDSVTRYAMRAFGKHVSGGQEMEYDEWDYALPSHGILLRYRHSGSASGITDWLDPSKKFKTFDLPPGGVSKAVWVINAGLWNTAWPTGVMNFNWSTMTDRITLPDVLEAYEKQLTSARNAILSQPGLNDPSDCDARSRLIFRLTTPVLNKVPQRQGWLTWANTAFGDLDAAVSQLNGIARGIWGDASLPVIELAAFTRDAPADVKPKLTVDNVHVPDGISMEMMWWLLSTLHDAGLSTAAGDGEQRPLPQGWPLCKRTGNSGDVSGKTAAAAVAEPSPEAAAVPIASPSAADENDPLNPSLLSSRYPGVPLALRRLAARSSAKPRPTLPPLPPQAKGAGHSFLSCTGRTPHSRVCRMGNVCLRAPGKQYGHWLRPTWHFYVPPAASSASGPDGGRRCLSTSSHPRAQQVCHGDVLLWQGALTENMMKVVLNVSESGMGPWVADRKAVVWHEGPVVAYLRHDTTNVAHTNSDDLFGAFTLAQEAWGLEWAGQRKRSPSAGTDQLTDWPKDANTRLLMWLDAGLGPLGGKYTTQLLPGIPQLRAHDALLTDASRLACFREVTVGAGGRNLMRNAGFGWDFAFTWSNEEHDDAAFFHASRQWFEHVRAVAMLPSLSAAAAGRATKPLAERSILIVNRAKDKSRYLANAEALAASLARVADGRVVKVVSWEGGSSGGVHKVAKITGGADVIISVHGAGNAHVPFATPCTTWIELIPEGCGIVQSMYESVARRVGVTWLHLPVGRVTCASPSAWVDPGRMCKEVLSIVDDGLSVDEGAVTQLVAMALQQQQPVSDGASLVRLLPDVPRKADAQALVTRAAAQRKVRPIPVDVTDDNQEGEDEGAVSSAPKPPRVVVFACFNHSANKRALSGLAKFAGLAVSVQAAVRFHKAVGFERLPDCDDADDGPPDTGKAQCFRPEGFMSERAGSIIGLGHRVQLFEDCAANAHSHDLGAWVAAIGSAEVVIAIHGSPAAALLPIMPLDGDWIDLVPPRDAARAIEYRPLAAAARVNLHTHLLDDPHHDCSTPVWDRDVLKVDAVGLAAKVAILLGSEL